MLLHHYFFEIIILQFLNLPTFYLGSKIISNQIHSQKNNNNKTELIIKFSVTTMLTVHLLNQLFPPLRNYY